MLVCMGAVVRNAGATASVVRLTVTALNLANACDAGEARLRGIMFQGASGLIAGNTVIGINQGPSGCQEGNAIEVRNFLDHPETRVVEIAHNTIVEYQKTGIVTNGDVRAWIHHNQVGGSATQANLAANSVQVGFGALGIVEYNAIASNSWLGFDPVTSDFAATAVLLFDSAPGSVVRHNNLMEGNADVGIYVFGDTTMVDNNRVFDEGPDAGYDIGIGDYGTGNSVTNNKVRGYDVPYDGVSGGRNKVVPSPR